MAIEILYRFRKEIQKSLVAENARRLQICKKKQQKFI